MKIEIQPNELYPGISDAYRVIEDGEQIRLRIDLKPNGQLWLCFNSEGDLQSCLNHIVQANEHFRNKTRTTARSFPNG